VLEKTITTNHKVRADAQYPIMAGVDPDLVPQLIKVKSDGTIDLGGIIMPDWDAFSCSYYPATNNVHVVIFTLQSNEVARWTFTYRNGAVADNDDLTSGIFLVP